VPVSSDPRIGSELFGYRLEALLGRGGMGVVYRAHDLALDRKVALKLLAPELAEDERFRSRFLRESRVAASLDHPNVIPIYEAGEAGGLLCIAMHYVEGTDLRGRLEDEQGRAGRCHRGSRHRAPRELDRRGHRWAWVLSSEGGSGVLTRVRPGQYPRRTTLGYDPLAVAAGAGAVWVAAKNATNEVLLRVDPSTGSVLRTVRLAGGDAPSIAVGDGAVWVLQSGAISRLDPATGRVTSKVQLPGWNVGQIAAGDAGVWATMRPPNGPRLLVHVDKRARRILKTIREPTSSTGTFLTRLAVGEGAVWWNTASGTIWRVDSKTYKIVRVIRVTPPPTFPAAFVPFGIATGAGAVWVTVTIGP
jgi:hypothetical protein